MMDLQVWAEGWGRRLQEDIGSSPQYFAEVTRLLGQSRDPQRARWEAAMNLSVAACFEYEAGRWELPRRNRQLQRAQALLREEEPY